MKTAGSVLIIAFFTSIGIKVVLFKRKQICFIEDIIYICDLLKLLLEGTLCETSEIIQKLNEDERLSKYSFFELEKSSPLNSNATQYIIELKELLGRYDLDIQLQKIHSIRLYFDELKKRYSDDYKAHSRLYIAFGISSGFLAVILLI